MNKNRIRFLFAGDFCSEHPLNIQLSKDIIDLLGSSDFKFLNFEGPLELGKLNIPNKTILPQSLFSPQWCEDNGFNIISLANNHSLDYNVEGLISTMKYFKKSTLLGVGDWDEAYSVKFIKAGDIKIGLIAATSYDFASLKDKWTDSEKIGCAWINSYEINKQIIENKNLCDYLFVISHGGLEYMNVPLPEWRDRYRELIDIGADAVIAMHPHVPQGTEVYKDKPIFYSLGNFCFDHSGHSKHEFWDNGLLVLIDIENGNVSHQVIPTIRNGNLIDINQSEKTMKHLNDISTILYDKQKYMEQVNAEIMILYPKYQQWLLSGFNSMEIKLDIKTLLLIVKRIFSSKSKPNLKLAMHQLREDSTRWAIIRALKLISKSEL